jgi:hypothetical protein
MGSKLYVRPHVCRVHGCGGDRDVLGAGAQGGVGWEGIGRASVTPSNSEESIGEGYVSPDLPIE